MNLQQMLDLAATDGPVHVEEGWGQGRATYGGLVTALLLAAITGRHDGELPPLRSITTSFVGPVAPGEAQIEPVLLRAGKNAVQYQATLRQGGQVAAVVLASFGAARDSRIAVSPTAGMPELPAPETLEPFPFVPGATPDFFQHVELRLATGQMPYTGSAESAMTGWMRMREPGPVFGQEHFVALADAWPPAVIQMLEAPAPGASLTWTLELTSDLDGVDPATHWAYAVQTDVAGGGYAHTDARIWRPDGMLTAISRQTVAIFG